jgi:hypothetical protein
VLLLLEPEAGDEAELVLVSFVVLELLELLPLAGLPVLSTTVVLLLLLSPDAGVTVSDFCSHAARSAALARMQMYFFIGFGCPVGSKPESKHARRADLRLTN